MYVYISLEGKQNCWSIASNNIFCLTARRYVCLRHEWTGHQWSPTTQETKEKPVHTSFYECLHYERYIAHLFGSVMTETLYMYTQNQNSVPDSLYMKVTVRKKKNKKKNQLQNKLICTRTHTMEGNLYYIPWISFTLSYVGTPVIIIFSALTFNAVCWFSVVAGGNGVFTHFARYKIPFLQVLAMVKGSKLLIGEKKNEAFL